MPHLPMPPEVDPTSADIFEDTADEGPDDLGYSDPNRYICTDPSCPGNISNCPGDNHPKEN